MTDGRSRSRGSLPRRPPPSANKLLIIGYGNSLRQDDGAGPILAAALAREWNLAQPRARFCRAHQLTPEIAHEIAEPDVGGVLFIDAELPATPPNAGAYWLTRIESPKPASTALGHVTAPQTVLLYARLLGAQPPAWLLTIPAYDLSHGQRMSSGTVESCANVLRNAGPIWEQIKPASEPAD